MRMSVSFIKVNKLMNSRKLIKKLIDKLKLAYYNYYY